MATLRMAGGNLLSSVADTANTVSTVMNTVSGSVQILNDMVQNVKIKRRISNEIEMESFQDNLLNEASLDAVKREENIRNYIGNDEHKAECFNKFRERLEKRLAKVQNNEE